MTRPLSDRDRSIVAALPPLDSERAKSLAVIFLGARREQTAS